MLNDLSYMNTVTNTAIWGDMKPQKVQQGLKHGRRWRLASICFTCSWACAGILYGVCNVCVRDSGLNGRWQRGTARGGRTQQVKEDKGTDVYVCVFSWTRWL